MATIHASTQRALGYPMEGRNTQPTAKGEAAPKGPINLNSIKSYSDVLKQAKGERQAQEDKAEKAKAPVTPFLSNPWTGR